MKKASDKDIQLKHRPTASIDVETDNLIQKMILSVLILLLRKLSKLIMLDRKQKKRPSRSYKKKMQSKQLKI